MEKEVAVEVAVLEAELNHVRKDLDLVKEDIRIIRNTLAEARGGWKTLMLVAGFSSVVGALLAKVAPWLAIGPR